MRKGNKFFFENLPVLPYLFSKTYPSFLTLKEGSTSHPDPLTLREEGGNRSSSSLGTATL